MCYWKLHLYFSWFGNAAIYILLTTQRFFSIDFKALYKSETVIERRNWTQGSYPYVCSWSQAEQCRTPESSSTSESLPYPLCPCPVWKVTNRAFIQWVAGLLAVSHRMDMINIFLTKKFWKDKLNSWFTLSLGCSLKLSARTGPVAEFVHSDTDSSFRGESHFQWLL